MTGKDPTKRIHQTRREFFRALFRRPELVRLSAQRPAPPVDDQACRALSRAQPEPSDAAPVREAAREAEHCGTIPSGRPPS